ncbi:MAG: hypothetical protein R2911_35440 [Caldilineaceae bacterium]
MMSSKSKVVTTAVIGTGHFATAVVTQAESIAELRVPVVVDIDVEAAQLAYERAGVDPANVVICESQSAALSARKRRQARHCPTPVS